ncbi:MAG: hypothetical protein LWY06_16370 [Firmicutes bacterium]|nr:hypothetical protein [Bacillota bacterium]
MDGIGFIGGPQRLTGLSGAQKPLAPAQETTGHQINDSLSSGYFSGSEIQDPRKAFMFTGSEVSNTSKPAAQSGEFTASVNADQVKPQSSETASVGGFFLSGSGDGFGFELNGPSSLSQGIVSLSGQNLNDSNPRVLFQE